MTNSPTNTHGRQVKPHSTVTVQVQVRREYAGLMRGIAEALGDPGREAVLRDMLRTQVKPRKSGDFKALLAAAPLEGVDLERPRDLGREIAF